MDFNKALAQYRKMNFNLLNDKIRIDDIVKILRRFELDNYTILSKIEEQIINEIYEEIRQVNPELLREKIYKIFY